MDNLEPSGIRNDGLKTQHPIVTQEYGVYTPPIHEFFATTREWIDNRVPGGYVFGPSRYGKSRAVKTWMKALIDETYGGAIPFFRLVYKNHDRVHEQEFLAEILTAIRHRYSASTKRAERLKRIVNFFCSKARNLGGNYVVIMIDEAQNMRDLEYRWLCNIQNDMDELGFRLTVISVGSQELAYQHELFSMGQDIHLMGRFMVRNARFHGIRSSEEMEYVLQAYDSQTEWPAGSGITFTQYYFPRAYAADFRIAAYAAVLWDIFYDLAPTHYRPYLEVPMEHIARSVESLFRKFGASTDHLVEFDEPILRAAVERTQYAAHMRTVARIPLKKSAKAPV